MPYPANFVDAHHRHWEDAQLLFRNHRWANADQLYGLCAECGLKAVMRRSRCRLGLVEFQHSKTACRHALAAVCDFLQRSTRGTISVSHPVRESILELVY